MSTRDLRKRYIVESDATARQSLIDALLGGHVSTPGAIGRASDALCGLIASGAVRRHGEELHIVVREVFDRTADALRADLAARAMAGACPCAAHWGRHARDCPMETYGGHPREFTGRAKGPYK